MDLSPFIDGMINHFGQRTVLGLSAEAMVLYRNRLSEAEIKQRITLFPIEREYPKGKPVTLPDGVINPLSKGNNLVMPVNDDRKTSRQAARAAMSVPNSLLAGTDYFIEELHSIDECSSREFPFDLLDIKVDINGEDVPCPLFLNGHIKLLRTVTRIDSPEHTTVQWPATRPIIWTGEPDRLAALEFFSENGLNPENTIAFHLTANSHDPYRDMLSKKSFLKVARHFIGKGFSVLLISGNLFNVDPLRDRSFRIHLSFMDALDSPACRLFYGDCLAEAEVLRLCTALLSGETGIAHIASAVGTPKVTIAANMFQTGFFLMTGQADRELIVEEPALFFPEIQPRSIEVIEAMEKVLQKS